MTGMERDEPIAYPDNAVLEEHHVAAWLRIGLRSVQRLDLPWFYLGDRTKRVLAADVVAWVKKKRVA